MTRVFAIAAVLAVLALGAVGQRRGTQELKVKIEAPELDKKMLLDKLNDHGADHGLHFSAVDEGFDYRIVFGTEQKKSTMLLYGSGGSYNTSGAAADVFDAKGAELFKFTRENRGSDAGATNAVAKEIIKRLLKWRELQQEGRSK